MPALGASALGVGPLAGAWDRAKPTVDVTSPSGVIGSATVAFTYSSPVGRAQVSYQFQIRTADGSTILYDSGTVVSGANSGITIPYFFAGGSEYQIWVRASDLFDTSDWSTGLFSVDLIDVNDYPDEPTVGSVYEIAINGEGYMLADRPERPVKRQLSVLEAPRFATGDTPFTEAVERYTFLGTTDWRGGAGQEYLNRTDSDQTRYRDSEGLNPFEVDALQLLPSTTQRITDTFATPLMVVAGDRIYVVTANGELTSRDTAAGSDTVFTITGAGAPQAMASDGTNWYYADGSNIYRNGSAADPGSAWQAHNAIKMEWVVDRLAIVYDDGDELCLSTLAPDGTEEVAGGRFKYPNTTDLADITGGDGYLWFIVNRGNVSQVHYWQVGSDDTYAANGLTLPAGQKATSLGFYLGNVFIRAVEPLESGSRVIIYRCIPSEGVLTPQRVLDWDDDADGSIGDFAGDDRFVLFSWREMTEAGASGVGCIDLSTGGWAKWLTGGDGDIYSVALWNGKLAFTSGGDGLFVEDATPVNTGWLESSISDLGSSLPKVFDEIRLTFDPLPSGGTVGVEVTIDGGNSYDVVGDTVATAGLSSFSNDLNMDGRSFGVRITLGATSSSPKIRSAQTKLHPRSIVDQVVVFPINCSDQVAALNGSILPGSAPGSGLKRTKTLEALTGSRVRLQDIDWPVTEVATIWEIVDVQTETIGVFNPAQNRRVDSAVTTVTLRRSQ
jgi:hypothetical protein